MAYHYADLIYFNTQSKLVSGERRCVVVNERQVLQFFVSKIPDRAAKVGLPPFLCTVPYSQKRVRAHYITTPLGFSFTYPAI